MSFIIDENGVQTQTLDEVVQELHGRLREPAPDGFGPEFVLEPTEIVPMIVGIFAEREVAIQNRVKEAIASRVPGQAEGVHADNVAAVTGTIRKGAAPSSILVRITGTPALDLEAGRVFRHNPTSTLWETVEALTIEGGGTVETTVASQEEQAIDIIAGTDWTVVVGAAGLDSVESIADSSLGRTTEGDEALEERRVDELGRGGTSTSPALRADVQDALREAGYASASVDRVFVNFSHVFDAAGRPPGSAEVLIADNGLVPDEAIASAIWEAIGLGTRAWGSVQVDHVDEDGETQDVRFSRAQNLEVWIRVTGDTTGTEVEVADRDSLSEQIVAAIVAYGDANHPSGRNVLPGSFAGSVYALAPGYFEGGVSVEVSLDGVSWSSSSLPVSSSQTARFDASRVPAVVFTP